MSDEERREATTAHRDVVAGFVVVSPSFARTLSRSGELRVGDLLDVDGAALVVCAIEPCGADLAGAALPAKVQVSRAAAAEAACVFGGEQPSWSWLRTLGRWTAWDLTVRCNVVDDRVALTARTGRWASSAFAYKQPAAWVALRGLLRGLGLDVVVQGEAIRAFALDDDELRALSYGRIEVAATVDASGAAVRRGLRCELIFGPTRDYACQCGKYEGTKQLGLICERCGVEVIASDVRAERMAHIELSRPYASPLFEGVEQRVLPVVPPRLRDSDLDQLYLDVLAADAAGEGLDDAVEALFVGAPLVGGRSLVARCDAWWADDLFQRTAELSGAAHVTVADVDPGYCLLPRQLAHELFRPHAERVRANRRWLSHLRPPDDEAQLRDVAALDEWVLLASGETTLLRRVRLWDQLAIGVDATAVASLPEVGAAVHVPVVAEAVLELQQRASPSSLRGWLSDAIGAESLVEAVAEAVVEQRAEPLGHPLVAAALGVRPPPLDAEAVAALIAAEAARRRARESTLDGDWTPPPALDLKLAELSLPPPLLAKLEAAGLSDLRSLCERTARDLLRLPQFGRHDLAAVTDLLGQHGLSQRLG